MAKQPMNGAPTPNKMYKKTLKTVKPQKSVIDMLVEGFSKPQPQSVQAIANRVRSDATKKMPKAKTGR